jgi:hypothetical protein
MELLSAYVPIDRYLALVNGTTLPDRTHGAALFADISGFTPLTDALVRNLGPLRRRRLTPTSTWSMIPDRWLYWFGGAL